MSSLPPRIGITAITENILKRKWSLVILRYFERGTGDPAEILASERSLSPKVMNERLRAMLRYGLIARFPRPSPSNVIEYRLSPFGKKFLELMDAIERLDQQPEAGSPQADVCHIIDNLEAGYPGEPSANRVGLSEARPPSIISHQNRKTSIL